MAALQALTGGLQPPNEDVEFLQQVGIIPTTTVQSAGEKTNVDTGTTDTGVLQAIQQLDTKLTNGFAQIMAKLSNTPMKGGGEINSKQPLEMSSAATAANSPAAPQPSFLNRITGAASNAASKIKNSASSMFGTAPSSAAPVPTGAPQPAPEVAPTPTKALTTLKGGAKKNSKTNNKSSSKANNKSSSTSTLENPMQHIQTMSSTTTKGGARKRKSRRMRKSRQRLSRRN
jgi:hypothetical protein